MGTIIKICYEFLADLNCCRQKLAKHYNKVFTHITLYTTGQDTDNAALYELYVPMVWKKVTDSKTVTKDKDIESPMKLFDQVFFLAQNNFIISKEKESIY